MSLTAALAMSLTVTRLTALTAAVQDLFLGKFVVLEESRPTTCIYFLKALFIAVLTVIKPNF